MTYCHVLSCTVMYRSSVLHPVALRAPLPSDYSYILDDWRCFLLHVFTLGAQTPPCLVVVHLAVLLPLSYLTEGLRCMPSTLLLAALVSPAVDAAVCYCHEAHG